MSPRVQIVGSYLSPYVRKVLACLNLKGIDYEIDPIVPLHGRRPVQRVAATDGVDTRHRHAALRRAANLSRRAERASELARAERRCDRASVPDLLAGDE